MCLFPFTKQVPFYVFEEQLFLSVCSYLGVMVLFTFFLFHFGQNQTVLPCNESDKVLYNTCVLAPNIVPSFTQSNLVRSSQMHHRNCV